MIRRSLIAMFLIIIIMIPAMSCVSISSKNDTTTNVPSSPKSDTTIVVTYDQFAKEKNIVQDVNVLPGGTIIVQLVSNKTTGYSWNENAQISDPAVLSQTGHSYVAPSDTGGRVGVAGDEVWTFRALIAGKSTVYEEYGQPWAGGQKGDWTFKLNVTVK
ncbi:MAG: protease inhibitor I42 family protein [Dehalococcoidia bacterium]|jgi:inhibitor of cysteine peptidase